MHRWLLHARAIAGLVLLDNPRSSCRVLGRAGAAFFVGGGLVVLTTLPWLPATTSSRSYSVIGITTLTVGAVLWSLPWARWDQRALLAMPILALSIMGLPESVVGDGDGRYVPLYILISAFVGLSQSWRWVLGMVPLTLLSMVTGEVTDAMPSVLVSDVIVVMASALCGAILAVVMAHNRGAASMLSRLFDTTRELGRGVDSADTVAVFEQSVAGLVDVDTVAVFLADEKRPFRFARVMPTLGDSTTFDLAHAPAELRLAVHSQLPQLIRDARRDPLGLPGVPGWDEVRSAWFAPLVGPDGCIGVVLLGWNHAVFGLTEFAERSLDILMSEAAAVFARQRESARVQAAAHTDALTGLRNRRSIDSAMALLEPGDAVMLIDVDRFKQVNADYGHAGGDRVLRSLAACLADCCRGDDWCGRWGGEEFVMVFRKGGDGAMAAAARVRRRWHSLEPVTTFSAGIAVHAAELEPLQTLSRADEALYLAKERGRDRIEKFVIGSGHPSIDPRASR